MKKVTLNAQMNEKGFINFNIETENGMNVPVRLSFYNRKLAYKLYCYVNNIKKGE